MKLRIAILALACASMSGCSFNFGMAADSLVGGFGDERLVKYHSRLVKVAKASDDANTAIQSHLAFVVQELGSRELTPPE